MVPEQQQMVMQEPETTWQDVALELIEKLPAIEITVVLVSFFVVVAFHLMRRRMK